MDVARLTKTGGGNMVLAGVNDCGTFTIAGGTVTLLNGDALNASGTTIIAADGTLDTTAANITQAILPQDRIDAAGWFRGVEPQHIYMVYDGSNVGLYCVAPLPEPTTSTLSLLALAALAASRRKTA